MDWTGCLAQHDDPTHREYPRGFSYDHAVQRFEEFAIALQACLGQSLSTESGNYIQDASFHSQFLFEGRSLRFSNFGDMIAFTPDVEVPGSLRQAVRRLAEQLEYVLVPTEILEERYTGSNPGVTGIQTWWNRYFDYI